MDTTSNNMFLTYHLNAKYFNIKTSVSIYKNKFRNKYISTYLKFILISDIKYFLQQNYQYNLLVNTRC